jgi:hypothetical protein
MRRRDVEKAKLVGSFVIVKPRDFDRVTSILKLEKPNAFDDPAGLHVETRNNPFGEHSI